MSRLQSRLLEFGVLAIVIALPIFVNPFGKYPYEPSKTVLFWVLIAVLGLVVISPALYAQLRFPLMRWPRPGGASRTWFRHPLAPAVMVYAAVYLLATLFSVDFKVSFFGRGEYGGALTGFMLLVFFFLVAGIFRSRQQHELLVSALIFGSIPVALYGWIQFLGLDGLYGQVGSELKFFIHGTFARHIYLGSYLAMVVPFTLTRVIDAGLPGRQRIRFGGILALQLTCLFLTLARSAYLALFAGLLVFTMLLAGLRDRRRLLLVLAVLMTIGPILLWSIQDALPTIHEKFGDESQLGDRFVTRGISDLLQVKIANNDLFRINIWKRALAMVTDRWLLGYGPETFILFQSTGAAYDPHNIFIYQLTALGLAGLVSFAWILIRFFRTACTTLRGEADLRQRYFLAAAISSVVIYLVQAQFNPETIVPVVLFWLLLAVGRGTIAETGATLAQDLLGS